MELSLFWLEGGAHGFGKKRHYFRGLDRGRRLVL